MSGLDWNQLNKAVVAVMNLNHSIRERYILVGGASLVCLGSTRVTSDIDLLFPYGSSAHLNPLPTRSPSVTRRGGKLYAMAGETEFPVDILETVIGDKTFEDLEPFTIPILGGIRTLDFPIALGIKIRSFFLRNDEVEAGCKKADSDIYDIIWITESIKGQGRMIDDVVAKAIPVGCYNMLLVKQRLGDTGALSDFLSIGGQKFQVPWEEDTDDQREYYGMMKMIHEEEGDL
ncbi:hypothetical protein C7212DRAFT_346707 [Tuber magnatum]|uniref:Nucleotidyl transferase AbiEii/AbiGii toxin family protein n=1 Tax=Tuber magnatum TaxID=42249 RepID=A0A317SH86_9PEZI|nr:hypothetical protein C7212DRAFT_346707 [Tuber magnatum]